TDDPSKDRCPGTVIACKLRYGEDNELSFGGFPASSLIRR
ncbi:phage minor tail protein L, partial [Xenorhabdus bovienii]|nr:phage minor tail protein L [Xenorhabdus bovienii]